MTQLEKHVPIAKADSGRQVALGVAMVPDSVDLAGDFERPATIERLAEGYMERLATGESKNGVMHSVFPGSDAISHVENRVLQSSETIGGQTYPAGTWVVGKKIHDDSIWELVESDVLGAFSIGGYVTETKTHDGPPSDVRLDETVKSRLDGMEVTEIRDARIEEISLVDSPAVPDAQVQVAKGDGDVAKAAPELTDSVDVATEYLAEERGHDEGAARELAEVLNTYKTASGDGSDTSPSWVARAKAFFSGSDGDERTEKVGATLSATNRNSLMQIHDASLNVLQDAGYASRQGTFTDDPRVDFELAADDQTVLKSDEPAESGSETNSITETMSDDDKDELFERIERIESAVEGLVDDDSDEETEKDDTSDDDEKVEVLADAVERLAQNQEKMMSAQGVSKQASTETTKTSDSSGSAFDPYGGR